MKLHADGTRAERSRLLGRIDIGRMEAVQTWRIFFLGAQSMFTAPAVLGRTVFIATAAGTGAYRLTGSGTPRLLNTWQRTWAGRAR